MSTAAWHGLVGSPGYVAGTSGTATVPTGSVIIAVTAHASAGGAAFTMLGGASVPVPIGSTISLDFKHALFQSAGGNNTLVFTGTDMYFVHWVKQGNA